MDNKLSELKVKIPADKKSRESVAAGYVTDNNSGGYFIIECQGCGAVYPSQHADGGGQIADTGDYNDAICPHCGEEGPEECENVGLAWNVQQAKIIALLAELEAKDKRIEELGRANQSQDDHINQQQDIIESLEKKNVDLGRALGAAEKRLATPVRLLGEMLPHEWERAERQAAFQHRKIAWDARLAEDKKAILAAGFTFTVEGDDQ